MRRRRDPDLAAPRVTPRDLLAEALVWMGRRRARSMLTALGTLLGVAAFVATMSVTSTVSAQVSDKFDALKATAVVVQQAGTPSAGEKVFPDDYERRLGRLNGVVGAGRFWRLADGTGLDARTGPLRGNSAKIGVIAAAPGALVAAGVHVTSGRLYDLGHETRGDRVAVLGSGAARTLGIDDLRGRPGLFLAGRAFTVIGIVDGADRLDEVTSSILLPEAAAASIADPAGARQNVLVQTRLGAAELIGGQAPRALRPDRPEALTVVLPPDPDTLRRGVEGDLRTLFLLLAAVSLVIGTVGIANTTLVSVMERVPEIGLRRALGAQRRHIAAQFLTESAALGSLGGLLGTSLAVIGVVVISLQRDWTPVVNPVLIFAAPLLGTLTGLLAGVYPALKAAAVTPVEALNRG